MSNKIIEKLKDDSHYYGVVGKQYLSSSDITTLLYEPEKFKEFVYLEKISEGQVWKSIFRSVSISGSCNFYFILYFVKSHFV